MSEKKIWVETIIDAFDLETTKEIARKAVEFGTDWISVGTNNMYACGFMHSIPAVKEIAGDIPVVADIKIHDGGNGFSVQAQKCGADYSVVSTRFNYGCARQAMIAYAKTGIKIIGDLCTVPVAEIPHYVAELQNIGIHAVRVHQTYDELKYRYMFSRSWDGVKEAKGVATIPVGCVVRTKEDIIHALEDGADYICLAGDVVDKAPEQGYEALKEYIDFVHNYQGCQSSNNHGGYSGYQAK